METVGAAAVSTAGSIVQNAANATVSSYNPTTGRYEESTPAQAEANARLVEQIKQAEIQSIIKGEAPKAHYVVAQEIQSQPSSSPGVSLSQNQVSPVYSSEQLANVLTGVKGIATVSAAKEYLGRVGATPAGYAAFGSQGEIYPVTLTAAPSQGAVAIAAAAGDLQTSGWLGTTEAQQQAANYAAMKARYQTLTPAEKAAMAAATILSPIGYSALGDVAAPLINPILRTFGQKGYQPETFEEREVERMLAAQQMPTVSSDLSWSNLKAAGQHIIYGAQNPVVEAELAYLLGAGAAAASAGAFGTTASKIVSSTAFKAGALLAGGGMAAARGYDIYQDIAKGDVSTGVGKGLMLPFDIVASMYGAGRGPITYQKVELPTETPGEGITAWQGLATRGGRALIGKTPEGLVIGTPGPGNLPLAEFSRPGYFPQTKLETRIMASKGTLKALGYSPEEIEKITVGTKIMGMVEKQPSIFTQKEFTRQIKTLSPKGVDVVFNYAKANKGDIVEIYGSISQQAQVAPEFLGRPIADIDMQLRTNSPDKAAAVAAKLVASMRAVGEDVYISSQKPTLIENAAGHHAVDIHYLGEPAPDVLNPNIQAGYGYQFGQKPIQIEKLPAMPLSEQALRKGTSSLTFQEQGFEPLSHRMKDVPDFYAAAESLRQSMSDQATKNILEMQLGKFKGLYPDVDFEAPFATKVPLLSQPIPTGSPGIYMTYPFNYPSASVSPSLSSLVSNAPSPASSSMFSASASVSAPSTSLPSYAPSYPPSYPPSYTPTSPPPSYPSSPPSYTPYYYPPYYPPSSPPSSPPSYPPSYPTSPPSPPITRPGLPVIPYGQLPPEPVPVAKVGPNLYYNELALVQNLIGSTM